MKKILLITTLFMVSCSTNQPDSVEFKPEVIPIENCRIYTLEGCEYIIIGSGNDKWGSHKGNCKNPLHITT